VHELAKSLAAYGKPESPAAVTRIAGMLQRKRPPTPPPLMMLPSEFSDVAGMAPTLVGSGYVVAETLNGVTAGLPEGVRKPITTASVGFYL